MQVDVDKSSGSGFSVSKLNVRDLMTATRALIYLALGALVILAFSTLETKQQDKVLETLVLVFATVGISAGVFVSANLLFSLPTKNWPLFRTILGSLFGFGLVGVLWGNRILARNDEASGLFSPLSEVRNAASSISESFGDNLATWLFLVWLVAIVVLLGVRIEERVTAILTVFALCGLIAGLTFSWALPDISGVTALLIAVIAGLVGVALSKAVGNPGSRLANWIQLAAGALAAVAGLVWLGDHAATFGTAPFVGALLGAVLTGALAYIGNRSLRLALGTVAGGALGFWLTGNIVTISRPSISWVAVVVAAAIGAAIGYGLFRSVSGALGAAAIGAAFGGFAVSEIGGGSQSQTVALGAIIGAAAGAALGFTEQPAASSRRKTSEAASKYIFAGPAIFFILMGLIFPLIRTIFLSFQDKASENWIGFDNYQQIFTDVGMFNTTRGSDFFTSQLFWIGGLLLLLGVVGALIVGISRGDGFLLSGGPRTSLFVGSFILFTAAMTVLRGSVFNNLWWVVTVTAMSTIFGMAAAVLADRAIGESAAKSLIFLPLAISFVGAGIIWRFMFQARPPSKDQTGVLNWLWVELGSVANETGLARTILLLIPSAMLLGLAIFAALSLRSKRYGRLGWLAMIALPIGLVLYRLVNSNLGGFEVTQSGEVVGKPILFLAEPPFNNVWLMVILIWIQTGFAMVIFSSAIKSVPAELIEAAQVDGATDSQVFWKVTLPHIAPTVGVVVTTLVVLVMKVFDIVKVTTDGDFDTQVIANEMWQRAFTEFNTGLGSALAVVLFVAVVPVMYLNIRRTQKAAAL